MQENQELAADVTAEVTEHQVDKFFESGGKELPQAENHEETTDSDNDSQQQEQVDQAEQQSQKQDKTVPYGALHEERERRKELQRQVQEGQQRISRMEQAFQKIVERGQQQPEKAPNFDEDPLEALRYNQTKLAEAVDGTYQTLSQQRQMQEQQARIYEFQQRCNDSVSEFIKQTPDYKEAYAYLIDNRLKEYQEAGYTNQKAKQIILEEEAAIAAISFQNGTNPAEKIYSVAKFRGYQPKAQQGQQKLAQIEKGIQASKSLSNIKGKSPSNELSLEALAQMNDDELAEYLDDKNWNKILKMG